MAQPDGLLKLPIDAEIARRRLVAGLIDGVPGSSRLRDELSDQDFRQWLQP